MSKPPGIVGREVRRLRVAKGLSVADLSRISGIAESGISECENGKRGTNERTVVALAKALAVPPAALYDVTLAVNNQEAWLAGYQVGHDDLKRRVEGLLG